MNRRSLVSGAAAGAVTLAAPRIAEGASVKESRNYVVKGAYVVDPEGDDPSVRVAIRLAPSDSPSWGPGGRSDEVTILVPTSEAHLWAFGKTFTMTITEY